jgi:GNAT superfamily N-acetyltransferase
MSVTYRAIETRDYDDVRRLFLAVGWKERGEDAERFERMIRGSTRTIAAYEDGRVVGFARALFDDASNGYISTVVVAQDRQGRGIGRELITRLMACRTPTQITWMLRAAPAARGFWTKMGFTPSTRAMEIARTE